MKIYIAGKITGDERYYEKFRAVHNRLELLGHVVLNPAELPEGLRRAEYMRVCFAMIDCAEAVLLLRGWMDSPGARIEAAYANYVGKEVHYEVELDAWEAEAEKAEAEAEEADT